MRMIWCAIFHRRWTRVIRREGEWLLYKCDKCRQTWPGRR